MAPGRFQQTRWSLVQRAGATDPDIAEKALSELCELYWYPIYAFVRRSGCGAEDAKDHTQGIFAQILQRGDFAKADPALGKLRSYLLGAVKNFLSKQRRDAGRLKRGGDVVVESIDSGGSETSPGLPVADPAGPPTDAFFDRSWALAVMERGLAAVEEAFVAAGKTEQFKVLKPWLIGDAEGLSQDDAAAELGMSAGAVKVAVHRLRHQFGEAVRSEIAETVDTEAEVRAELRYLIEALQVR